MGESLVGQKQEFVTYIVRYFVLVACDEERQQTTTLIAAELW